MLSDVCVQRFEFSLLFLVTVQQSIKKCCSLCSLRCSRRFIVLFITIELPWAELFIALGEDELSGKFKVGQRDVALALRPRRVSGLMSWPPRLNGMEHHRPRSH